jgi:hypothetical protein
LLSEPHCIWNFIIAAQADKIKTTQRWLTRIIRELYKQSLEDIGLGTVDNLSLFLLLLRSGAFERCLGHEGFSLINGIDAFIKETQGSWFVLLVVTGHIEGEQM